MTAPPVPAYPATPREETVETIFGHEVADPYRWLENDVRGDLAVRAWVSAENAVTRDHLAALPGRDAIRDRLTALWDYQRHGVPLKRGGRYFHTRNDGLQNQAVLYVRDAPHGTSRPLIDPNAWSDDGAVALAEWVPSQDGARLAYAVQDGGSDWRTIRVLDVAGAAPLADEVRWVKFSAIAWAKNGAGFFYSRFPEPKAAATFQMANLNHAIYFHALGTDQSVDRLVHAAKDRPRLNHVGQVTDDGGWLVVTSSEGTDHRYEVMLIDLTSARPAPRILVRGLEHNWQLVGNEGTLFYFVTDLGAPRQRVVAMDVTSSGRKHREIVPEDEAKLEGASLVGDKLILSYLVDAASEARVFTLAGRRVATVALPGLGTVSGFDGAPSDPETFFAFTSYATPATIHRLDTDSGEQSVWEAPRLAFDPADYQVEQRFFASKDGTRVPLFLVRRRGLDMTGGVPTLLYGYGGFSVSLTPAFSPAVLAWLEMGGAYAVANIRGGGEYGEKWHDAGRRAAKQNVFDDFIAAAEHLVREGVTTPAKLAIRGGSNGGLLVGAVVNQRPALFAAALPDVGVMDMLRFHRFTAGRYWVDDYGDPARPADFAVLRGYSPYHNIRSGERYPAILVTTADTDDRVVPGHSFKYAAALQAAEIGGRPHLIRIETRAGHGSGKPTAKLIDEYADVWAFAGYWTGLTARPGGEPAGEPTVRPPPDAA